VLAQGIYGKQLILITTVKWLNDQVVFPGVSVTSSPVTGQRGVQLPGREIFYVFAYISVYFYFNSCQGLFKCNKNRIFLMFCGLL
jgi:hypothetical protein